MRLISRCMSSRSNGVTKLRWSSEIVSRVKSSAFFSHASMAAQFFLPQALIVETVQQRDEVTRTFDDLSPC